MDHPTQPLKPLDEHIVADSLKVIARFSRVNRAQLALLNQDWRKKRSVFSWPEKARQTAGEPDLWMQSGWWLRRLGENNYYYFRTFEDLPGEVLPDVSRLKREGVHSFGLMTLYDGKRLSGILRLDNPPQNHEMTHADIGMLEVASTLILQVVKATTDISSMAAEDGRSDSAQWHDADSGLPNRGYFVEQLRDVFRRKGRLFAVLLVEIDCFSLIEHRYGTETSQRLFMMAAERINSGLRTSDFVARLDQDQIGILLVDLFENSYAETVGKRILSAFHTPFRINGKDIGVTASVGAAFPDMGHTLSEPVLQEAYIAMRHARRSINTHYMAFDAVMRQRLLDRLELENDLRGSMDRDQLRLHYQPITAAETGRLAGFEALVRWQHPTRGLIWPTEFIRLSEDTGLIVPLGNWVLREACRQMRIWQETLRCDPALVVSVNISARQLQQQNFPAHVAQILRETGLPPHSLRLEITESVMIDYDCGVIQFLEELRALGVQLCIDDFGTGYSSLGYLNSLPADEIKIDRSFVTNLGKVQRSQGVVQAIIQMAHGLNIKVVAEGVETVEQHDLLRQMQCEYLQGFLISQPIESEKVEDYIRKGPGDYIRLNA